MIMVQDAPQSPPFIDFDFCNDTIARGSTSNSPYSASGPPVLSGQPHGTPFFAHNVSGTFDHRIPPPLPSGEDEGRETLYCIQDPTDLFDPAPISREPFVEAPPPSSFYVSPAFPHPLQCPVSGPPCVSCENAQQHLADSSLSPQSTPEIFGSLPLAGLGAYIPTPIPTVRKSHAHGRLNRHSPEPSSPFFCDYCAVLFLSPTAGYEDMFRPPHEPINNGAQVTSPDGVVSFYNPHHPDATPLPLETALELYSVMEDGYHLQCLYIDPTTSDSGACLQTVQHRSKWLEHFLIHVREEHYAVLNHQLYLYDSIALKHPTAMKIRWCNLCNDWISRTGYRVDREWNQHIKREHPDLIPRVKKGPSGYLDVPWAQSAEEPPQKEAGLLNVDNHLQLHFGELPPDINPKVIQRDPHLADPPAT